MRSFVAVTLVVAAALSHAQFTTTVTPDIKEQAKKAPVDPKLDRSGEAKLKAVFAKYGAIKNVHIVAVRYSDSDGPQLTRQGDIDFYRNAAGEWRFESSEVFGASFQAIGGKDSVLVNELNSRPQVVLDPARTIAEVLAVPAVSDRATPIIAFLAGAADFDKFVAKDAVISLASKDEVDTIEYKSNKGQVIRLTVVKDQVVRAEAIADFGAKNNPTTRDVFSVDTNPTFAPWTFDATPEKAFKVEDRRKKKG